MTARLTPPQGSSRALRGAARLVDRLRVSFEHYGRSNQHNIDLPLLSAGALSELDLAFIALNTHPFNEFVGSHHNVYFFPIFSVGDRPPPKSESTDYGATRLLVQRAFVRKHGWVSAFVMYPGQLADLTGSTTPQEHAQLTRDLMTAWVERTRERDYSPAARAARRQLGRFDFTVPDFERLVRLALVSSLAELHANNRAEFRRVLEALRRGHGLSDVIQRHVYGPLGFARGGETSYRRTFEGKLPGFVPRDELIQD